MNSAVWPYKPLRVFYIVALTFLWAGMVIASEQKTLDPADIPLRTWGLVFLGCLIGYLASSAEMLFGWAENRGWREAGKVVQSFCSSIAAGFIAYMVARYWDMSPIVSLISVLPASYAGENYMRKLAERQADRDANHDRDRGGHS